MPTTKNVKLSSLKLDLHNYRTVQQRNETHAANALIAIHPEWFWALMESLLEDGYLPTENIIVLKSKNSNVVKEGNRRIASLKIAHGLIKNVDVPDHIQEAIKDLPKSWIKNNESVPCAIYPASQAATVKKIVSRTHAKGQASGRDTWTSVARARYGRDENGSAEPGLDLLELYFKKGKNHSASQSERWAGDYPLTVLDEALKKLAPLINFKNAASLTKAYPGKNKRILDKILYDIGISHLTFKRLRDVQEPWQVEYGIDPPDNNAGDAEGGGNGSSGTGSNKKGSSAENGSNSNRGRGKNVTQPSNDPRAVKKLIREFKVRGDGRQKVATLSAELGRVDLVKNPHAFCFVLRSIFEISAKAYCDDHKKDNGPSYKRNDGKDKALVDVLRGIASHMTNGKKDKAKLKTIHGAMSELAKPDGILSVTSMNQLVHHPTFSVQPPDICILFGNLFPFLEELNK